MSMASPAGEAFAGKALHDMKILCFFDLPFVRHDKNVPEVAYYRRVLAGDKVFYAYDHQFSDAGLLDKLVAGDRVYIGAHQLEDGSYWLHWMVSTEKGMLQPKVATASKLLACLKLLSSLLIMGVSGYGYFGDPRDLWVMVPALFVFCFGAWLCFVSLQILVLGMCRPMRRLLQGFEEVRQGKFSICRSPSARRETTSRTNDQEKDSSDSCAVDVSAPEDAAFLLFLPGVAGNVTAKKVSVGLSESHRVYIDYEFPVQGARAMFRTPDNHFSSVYPLFFRKHSFFVAQNDPVVLAVDMRSVAVIGVCNKRDACAYVKIGYFPTSFQRLKMLYMVLLGFIGLMMTMAVFFIANDWWKQGGIPDKWDWLHAADMLFTFALMGGVVCCGIVLVVELIVWYFDEKQLQSSEDFVCGRKTLELFKRRLGSNAYIQEVP